MKYTFQCGFDSTHAPTISITAFNEEESYIIIYFVLHEKNGKPSIERRIINKSGDHLKTNNNFHNPLLSWEFQIRKSIIQFMQLKTPDSQEKDNMTIIAHKAKQLLHL